MRYHIHKEGLMQPSDGHPFLRPGRLNSYTAYAIGSAVAWAVVWAIAAAIDPSRTVDHLVWVFTGWVIGWTSATIARAVYPPPKKRSSATATSFFQGFREN
jgi:hypothetical protein